MKDILVGYTGFVGSNIIIQHKFDGIYNSSNVKEAYETNPDLCVYAAVRSEMFLANSNPDEDFKLIEEAIHNIKRINPKKIVLVSTIAVYNDFQNVDEDTEIDEFKCLPYGKHRLYLERWVQSNFKEYLIIRLPAIYGENLKKNYIYDMINISPILLKKDKFEELCKKNDFIKDYYVYQENGFYKCTNPKKVKPYFLEIGFSALNFTDSRSIYQFYNLENIWKDIEKFMDKNVKLVNFVTEPTRADELYEYIFKNKFENEVTDRPFNYDIKSKYFKNGYMKNKTDVLIDIKSFIEERVQA